MQSPLSDCSTALAVKCVALFKDIAQSIFSYLKLHVFCKNGRISAHKLIPHGPGFIEQEELPP